VLRALATRRLRFAARYGSFLGVGGLLLSLAPVLLRLDETIGLGMLFAARGAVPAPTDVVLVNISRDSAEGVGQTAELDEWPRRLHAALIDTLSAAGAAGIAFDIMFEEPRDDDPILAAAIAAAGNVILAERVVDPTPLASGGGVVVLERVPPTGQLKDAALATAPFTLPKVPIRVSQFWTFGPGADVPSLPVSALQVFLLPYYEDFIALLSSSSPALLDEIPTSRREVAATRDFGAAMRRIRIEFQRDAQLAPSLHAKLRRQPHGPRSDALRLLVDIYDGSDSRYLNYYGPPQTIQTIPYDVARDAPPEKLAVAGKMVFVGFAELRQSEQDDDFFSVFSQSSGDNLSGAEIGASAFANLLGETFVVPLTMPLHLLLVLGWGFLLGAIVIGSSTRMALGLAASAAALYAAVGYWSFAQHELWIPVLVPLFIQVPAAALVAVFLNYRQLMSHRERVQVALGYYVPAAVVTRLAEQSVSAAADKQLLYGTCLFTDAEEYTTVSEALGPDDLAALMNDYYRVMFRVVERYGGIVSDTSGDSMVAVWTAASPDASLRAKACHAAPAILEAVAEFNRGRGGLQLPTRVGLESGRVLLGNIGAEQRFEYRAIGDIVNTASRLQGLNRLLKTRVLMSEATIAGVPDIPTRDVGMFLLRGKKTPIRVHEPLVFDDHPGEHAPMLAAFAAALEQFELQRWADAQRAFTDIVTRYPADGPSAFYVGLSAEYQREPRPWSGAISIAVK
jgi:adenylate cyclase